MHLAVGMARKNKMIRTQDKMRRKTEKYMTIPRQYSGFDGSVNVLMLRNALKETKLPQIRSNWSKKARSGRIRSQGLKRQATEMTIRDPPCRPSKQEAHQIFA
jgi:hypothetical protein